MLEWFQKMLPIKTFYVLLVKIVHLEKVHVISTSVYLSLFFQEKMSLMRVLIYGNGEMDSSFS